MPAGCDFPVWASGRPWIWIQNTDSHRCESARVRVLFAVRKPVSAKRQGKRSTFWFILAERRAWVLLTSTVALNSGLTQLLTKGFPCLALNCHACPLAVTACPIGVIQHFVG
jgi:hypothetical protein